MDSVTQFFIDHVDKGYTESELEQLLLKKGFPEERVKSSLAEYRNMSHKPYKKENEYHFIELGILLLIILVILFRQVLGNLFPAGLNADMLTGFVIFMGIILQIIIMIVLFVHKVERKLYFAPLVMVFGACMYVIWPKLFFLPAVVRGISLVVILLSCSLFIVIYSVSQVYHNLMLHHLEEERNEVEWYKPAVLNLFLYYVPIVAISSVYMNFAYFTFTSFIYSLPIFYLVARRLEIHDANHKSTLKTSAAFGFILGTAVVITGILNNITAPIFVASSMLGGPILGMIVTSFLRFHLLHKPGKVPARDFPVV